MDQPVVATRALAEAGAVDPNDASHVREVRHLREVPLAETSMPVETPFRVPSARSRSRLSLISAKTGPHVPSKSHVCD